MAGKGTKVTAPVAGYSGVGPGGVVFDNGVGYTDDDALLNYFAGAGYGVGSDKPATDMVDVPDARDFAQPEVQGTKLRDAAVDPESDDYLPPINAGKADPHGPAVVAPGLHTVPPAPIVPGAVTEAKEISAATQTLVEGQDVGDVIAAHSGDDTGPLEMSDPSSGEFKATGVADSEGAVTPAKRTTAKKTTRKP